MFISWWLHFAAAQDIIPNANFKVALTFADGTTKSGHVIRVERSQDWYGEKEWVDQPVKLMVELEGNGTNIDKSWSDIHQVDLKQGSKTDFDCMYESEYSPWMYTCTLKTPTTVKTTDGKTWSAQGRHKWRFTFDNGETALFWLTRLPARRQESAESNQSDAGENIALYTELQKEALATAKTSVTRIVITP